MKTLKQKVQEYALKKSNDTSIEPTMRVVTGVITTDIIKIIEAHDHEELEDLIYENEENEFLKKIYLRFSLALVVFSGILIYLLCQK